MTGQRHRHHQRHPDYQRRQQRGATGERTYALRLAVDNYRPQLLSLQVYSGTRHRRKRHNRRLALLAALALLSTAVQAAPATQT